MEFDGFKFDGFKFAPSLRTRRKRRRCLKGKSDPGAKRVLRHSGQWLKDNGWMRMPPKRVRMKHAIISARTHHFRRDTKGRLWIKYKTPARLRTYKKRKPLHKQGIKRKRRPFSHAIKRPNQHAMKHGIKRKRTRR